MTTRATTVSILAALAVLAACNSGEPDAAAPPSSEAEMEPVVEEADSEPAEDQAANGAPAADNPAADVATIERLEAHEHGAATLAVTVQGGDLAITFDAPLSSLGVSENPQTEEDKAQIEALKTALQDWTRLVTVEGSDSCSLYARSTSTRIANGHGEVEAEYAFACEDTGALRSVRFTGFEAYPALADVDAVYVSDTAQKAGELTPSSPVLDLN